MKLHTLFTYSGTQNLSNCCQFKIHNNGWTPISKIAHLILIWYCNQQIFASWQLENKRNILLLLPWSLKKLAIFGHIFNHVAICHYISTVCCFQHSFLKSCQHECATAEIWKQKTLIAIYHNTTWQYGIYKWNNLDICKVLKISGIWTWFT